MQIKILDEAEKDIALGISFYEAQKDNLGKYFLDSIVSDIESLHIYGCDLYLCSIGLQTKFAINYTKIISELSYSFFPRSHHPDGNA